jgi:hypothetical protein
VSDSWITFEFVRIRVDSVGDESSFAGFSPVSGKKTARPWVSPGPRARQAGHWLGYAEGKEGRG